MIFAQPAIFTTPMKKYLFSLLVLLCCLAAQADTTDFYRVNFRGRQIANFSQGQVLRVVLKADSVFSDDSIFVNVFRDAPCGKGCEYSMLIFGNKGPMLVDSTQHTQSFYIPLKPLIDYHRQNGTREFNGYYTEYLDKGRSRVISFRILLE